MLRKTSLALVLIFSTWCSSIKTSLPKTDDVEEYKDIVTSPDFNSIKASGDNASIKTFISKPSTPDEVLRYCLIKFNKSCSCMKRYGDSVEDFSCVEFKKGRRCYSENCQVCRRSSKVGSCGFSGFFSGCKKECLCSCGKSSRIETNGYPVKIKCGQWCDGQVQCPNSLDEKGPNCRHRGINLFTKMSNLVWLLGCGLLIYYIFKRREALAVWMNEMHRHPAYQPPAEQNNPDIDRDLDADHEFLYYGRQGASPSSRPRCTLRNTNTNEINDSLAPPSYDDVTSGAVPEPPVSNQLPPPSYEESTKNQADTTTARMRT